MKTCIIVAAIVVAMGSPALAHDEETTISGFVDASYFHDVNSEQGEFGLDQAEIDVIHQASEKTLVRADLEWLKDGDDFVAQVEQAFVQHTCNWGNTFTFGRFNAPIGFELVDPNEMYQYSHSLVFTYGLPVNLTGAMLGREIASGVDAKIYAVNGWDNNAETNKVLTFGGRVGYTRDAFSGGVSLISGDEDDTIGTRTVYDIDLAYKPEGWVFGGEINSGTVELGASEYNWFAHLLMAHYDFNDRAGLTVRYDSFADDDGGVFGATGANGAPLAQTRRSFTIAPTLVLDDGFGALVELRLDLSDEDVFTDSDGKPTDSATTVAFEMTYAW